MVIITKEIWENNDTEVLVDNNGILWPNKKHIEEKLGHANSPVIARRYPSKYRKHRYELVDKPEKQPNRMFLHEDLTTKIIMGGRITKACKFRERLGFNSHDGINTKEQTVLKAIKEAFERENMQTQYSILGCRLDLYFHDYKFSIELDGLGHNDRNIDYEIQRQKAI